eukprot:TRINITY_DN4080_c0_g1_i6.p1 TRINITY_DN4080_c0_g1~~TRINITY_DN4080_c0_g1_i6.p1  ORF type:complete len:344 (-),score=79.29 TRINITY_DN4080_c0_g1_i6:292-1323(-)
MSPLEGLSDADLYTAIRNATGPRNTLFIPEMSFELLVKRQISRLNEPSLQCVDAVFEELQRIVSQLESKELLRYNLLREALQNVVKDLLQECREPTRKMITNLINMELSYINTAHPDFVGAEGYVKSLVDSQLEERIAQQQQQQQEEAKRQAGYPQRSPTSNSNPNPNPNPNVTYANTKATNLQTSQGQFTSVPYTSTGYPPQNMESNVVATRQPTKRSKPRNHQPTRLTMEIEVTLKPRGPLSDKETMEIDQIKRMIESYFDIVRKNIQDTVPKAIMHFLVNKSKFMMHNRLVERLYKEDKLSEFLTEAPEVARNRESTRKMVNTLKKAQEILNEVRDFSFK